jgi:hypothetical protein
MTKNYYFILMSQKDFLENQVIEELLRERANYYTNKNRIKDFWIINTPTFIKSVNINEKIIKSNFYKQKYKQINSKINNISYEFYTALVTSDFEFIKWIQLRLGYFEDIENLGTLNNYFVSDGIFGKLSNENIENLSMLESSPKYIHPDILLTRYKKSIEIYYN